MSGKRTKEYKAWIDMKQRCLNPNNTAYMNYGGRGITVCREWRDSFKVFFEAVGPAPAPEYTIDRLNNDGNYEPGNVAWRTRKDQINNRRPFRKQRYHGRTRIIEAHGRRLSAIDWSRLTGIPYTTIVGRIVRNGWDPERAIPIDRIPA